MQHATCIMQHGMCNLLHATWSIQHAMCNVQCAMFNMECALCNVQRATCNVQRATCNVPCNTQHATFNAQHATRNAARIHPAVLKPLRRTDCAASARAAPRARTDGFKPTRTRRRRCSSRPTAAAGRSWRQSPSVRATSSSSTLSFDGVPCVCMSVCGTGVRCAGAHLPQSRGGVGIRGR